MFFSVFLFDYTAIVKRCLELYEFYDLILNSEDLALLSDYVQLLSLFEVFTAYAQGKNYPTMNSVLLFRTEIIEK